MGVCGGWGVCVGGCMWVCVGVCVGLWGGVWGWGCGCVRMCFVFSNVLLNVPFSFKCLISGRLYRGKKGVMFQIS